jgi:type II secretory pathway pseudopilin PulG
MVMLRGAGRRRAQGRRRGKAFTLIETALATIIIGVGVLALIESQQAFMKSNNWSTHSATAAYLANEVREIMRRLPKHDPVTGLYLESGDEGNTLVGWGPEGGETDLTDFDDLDDFDGMVLSADGTVGPEDGNLPGPVDAFGNIIPEIAADGTVRTDEHDIPMALQGWSQRISVEKVDPYNTAVVRSDEYVMPAQGTFPGLGVDKFPLRVTVTVRYQGPGEANPTDIAKVVWIVP